MGTWADTSNIVDGQTIDAADVKTPLDAVDQALYDYIARVTTQPAWSLHKNGTNQSLAHATDSKLTWSTADLDISADFDDANDRIVPSVAGYYLVIGHCRYTAVVDQKQMTLSIRKNGATIKRQAGIVTSGVATQGFNVMAIIECNGSTDYLEIYSQQNTGVAQNVSGDTRFSYFDGFLIQPSSVITA